MSTAALPTDPKELSIAIAQEIMGWALKQTGFDPETYGAPIMAWCDAEGNRRAWATAWFDHEPFSPATSYEDAFAVVQHLILLGYIFSYDSYPNDPDQDFTPEHSCCITSPDGHDTGDVICPTMPEAICRAGLNAVRMYAPKKGTS